MERRNILIVKFAYEQIGGIDRQILRISKLLKESGDYELFLVTNNLDAPLSHEFKNIGKTFKIDFNNLSIIKGGKRLSLILKDNDIDIVQSHLFRESLICRVACFYNNNIKHVFRAQTYIDCAWIPNWKKSLYHILDKLTSCYVDKYIANGPEVEKEIVRRSFIPRSKVVDVINGSVRIGNPDVIKMEKIPYKIAMVSNLLEKKGHDVLIKGLSLLKEQGFIVKVRLIGGEISGGPNYDGFSFKSKLIKLANKYNVIDQIEFYGYSSDIVSALNGFPVVVLPSDSEGVPNCILEAMSLNKLVIVSDVGAVYKIVDNGINGFLHKPCNPLEFAITLKKVLLMEVEEINEIRNRAYCKWQNNFSLEKMVKKLRKEYMEL